MFRALGKPEFQALIKQKRLLLDHRASIEPVLGPVRITFSCFRPSLNSVLNKAPMGLCESEF